MALNSSVIYSSLLGARNAASYPMNGPNFDKLSLGVANALQSWAVNQPQNLALTGKAFGVAGVGAILPATSKLVVPLNAGVVQAAFQSAGLLGPLGQSLATILASGISTSFSTYGQYSGISSSVGVGSDISQITIVNYASLLGILIGSLSLSLGPGAALAQMATAIASGVSALLLQGSGLGPITGSGSPYPSVGVTTSVVV